VNLKPAQLPSHLRGNLQPLYVLHGDEPLLVLEAADLIRATARDAGYDERDTLVVGHSFRWDSLSLAADNLSLFGSHKLIDLRIPNGKPGRDGGEALQRYVKTLDDTRLTLITFPELDWQARKSAWFRALVDAGVVIELNAPTREGLPAWIAQRLGRQQQSASAQALDFLSDHVEGNLLAAHQEIQKLALLYPEGELSLEAVQEAVLSVARYDVDKLREAMLNGDAARCVRLLDGLRAEGSAPPLLLWALSNEVRTLAALQHGQQRGQPLAALFKQERVFDTERRQALNKALPRLAPRQLHAALMHAARIDRIIKGLKSGDIWEEFLILTLRLARPASQK